MLTHIRIPSSPLLCLLPFRARQQKAAAAAERKGRQKKVSSMAKSVGSTVAQLRRDAQTRSFVPANGGAGTRAGAAPKDRLCR